MSEARAVAGLRHPGIVAVHDILWEGSAPYIVMERLEGETLRDLLHRGAIPEDMARTIWLQIVRALPAAHGQGLIHRDLNQARDQVPVFSLSEAEGSILGPSRR